MAKTASGWLKTLNEKLNENEYYLSEATIAAISVAITTKNLTVAAVVAGTLILEGLLRDFYETWKEIHACMLRLGYHVEIANFYRDLLYNDGIA